MKRYIANGSLFVLLGLVALVAGCASYYKVKDPQTGNVYYTQKIEELKGGAVKLKDTRSGNTVTIQNSEIKQLNSDEYHAGLAVQEAASTPPPTPAPAPAAELATPATPAPIAEPAPAATPGATPGGTQ